MALKSRSPLGERVFREGGFAGLCTVLQFGDGGYRFPPGPSDGVIGTSHKNSGNTLEKSKKKHWKIHKKSTETLEISIKTV